MVASSAQMNPGYHETRFHFDPRREVLWSTLCDSYLQGLISPEDCVLYLRAGYRQFNNNILARRRIALPLSCCLRAWACLLRNFLYAREAMSRAPWVRPKM